MHEVDLYVVEEENEDDELFMTDIEEPNGVVSTLWLLAAVAS